MNKDLLYLVQQSKYWVESPELDESDLSTETDASLPKKQWVRQINTTQRYIQNLIVKSVKDYFGKTKDYTLTAGTSEYALPSNAVQVKLFERTDPIYDQAMGIMELKDKYDYSAVASVYPTNEVNWYTIWGNNLYISPTTVGSSATAKLWYIKRMAELHQGTADSVTSSTIVFPETPNLGAVSNEDDYYNGARLKITSATTNAGQTVEITDYVASTRTATVSWTSGTPTGTIKYSILSEIPEDYEELVTIRTALNASIKDKDSEAYGLVAGKYNELERDMITGLSRMMQEPERVTYNEDPYYD